MSMLGVEMHTTIETLFKKGYNGSYDTIKRYVSKIKKEPSKAYIVLNTLPKLWDGY